MKSQHGRKLRRPEEYQPEWTSARTEFDNIPYFALCLYEISTRAEIRNAFARGILARAEFNMG